MYGRRYQRKRGFKRAVVTLLSLVMLLSVCFPGLQASAEGEENAQTTVEEKSPDGTVVADVLAENEEAGVPEEEQESDDDSACYETDDSQTFAVTAEAESVTVYAGGDPQQELSASYYDGSVTVYWDTMAQGSNGKYSSASGGSKPDMTVTLAGKGVTWANSGSSSTWTGGSKLSTYYPDAAQNKMTDATLSITPPAGYYVSKIVVACTSGGNTSPYSCQTWLADNAYSKDFSFTGTGAFELTDFSSLNFSHGSNSGGGGDHGGPGGSGSSGSSNNKYFILIELAPIPTPLYVQYNYGNIVDILRAAGLDDAIFSDADGWTSITSGNDYGNGKIDTEYTQYRYEYTAGKPEEAANWKHYANTVTAEAKEAAAAAGYYFAGWSAQLYTACTVSNGPDSFGNNYTYAFSGEHSTVSYNEEDQVVLKIHTKLTAIWKPIELKVTKEVTGLPSDDATTRSFTIQVEKLNADNAWESFGDPVTLQVTGNNTTTSSAVTSGGSVCAVTPGQYRVVETAGNLDVEIGDATYYVSVTEETMTVSAGTRTGYTLKVTNTYNTTSGTPIDPDSSYIIVKKVFTGIQKNQIPEGFRITVEGNDKTYTLTNTSDAENGIQFSESTDGLTWTWKITNAAPGTCIVKEGNVVIANYDLTASPEGILTETGANVSVTGSNITVSKIDDIHTCKNTTFTIEDGTFFAAALTTKGQKCCVVITEQPLSASAQAAITAMIKSEGGEWKTDNGVLFYSIAEYKGQTITVQNSDITVSADGNAITFAATCNWSNAMTAEYDYEAAQAGDIEITNSYTPSTTSVTITKTVAGNMGDVTKAFPFEVTLSGGTMTAGAVSATEHSVAYTVNADGTKITFNLKDGEQVVLQDVPLEAKLTVTENYASTYEVTIDGTAAVKDENGSASVSDITVTEGMTISVVNTKNVNIDTGVMTDSAPFVVLFVLAAIGTCAVLVNKRRYDAKF